MAMWMDHHHSSTARGACCRRKAFQADVWRLKNDGKQQHFYTSTSSGSLFWGPQGLKVSYTITIHDVSILYLISIWWNLWCFRKGRGAVSHVRPAISSNRAGFELRFHKSAIEHGLGWWTRQTKNENGRKWLTRSGSLHFSFAMLSHREISAHWQRILCLGDQFDITE